LEKRIRTRVEKMYQDGLLDEVDELRRRFPGWSTTAQQAIGYAEALTVRDGQCTLAKAKEKTILRTRQLAKRQMTWFRRQAAVDWIDVPPGASVADLAVEVQSRWKKHGPTPLAI
jgi:tRNA dimethylallyltransferase